MVKTTKMFSLQNVSTNTPQDGKHVVDHHRHPVRWFQSPPHAVAPRQLRLVLDWGTAINIAESSAASVGPLGPTRVCAMRFVFTASVNFGETTPNRIPRGAVNGARAFTYSFAPRSAERVRTDSVRR